MSDFGMKWNYLLVTGSFDILHIGHIKLFRFAKSLKRDYILVIAIDSDDRIKSLKGRNRPINSQFDRQFMLQNIDGVSVVEIFNNDQDLVDICNKYNNPIRVVGSDYKNKTIIGEEQCSDVVYFNRIEKYSTTNIIERINEKNTISS